ncbi:MAG TPA: phospholipase A [Burkholderiales bacterium]|nr:phospholipase A [Burkholderiales bacterium]
MSLRVCLCGTALLAVQALLPGLLLAADEPDYAKCRDIQYDKERLACFDNVDRAKLGPRPSYLERQWKLGPGDERISIDDVQSHRPTYVLVGKWTNHANTQPSSPAPDHTVPVPIPYNDDELAFQLSFKSELVSRHEFGQKFLGLSNLRLWFAYTQQSYWQLYTPRLSRPFRETDYEPEVILTFGTGNAEDGWKLINFGAVHQSNGRALPQSRSWNRLYAQGGWEWGRLSVLGRAWWRIPESEDDNPDIQDYLGHGDVLLRWGFDNDKSMSLLLRHSFSAGRGFAQLDWTSRKLFGAARIYVQATSGYGESLIDYNFRQNTIGVGFTYGER